MIERVILPLDGSELAERALGHATELAERLGAPLTLLRAYDGPLRSARTLALMPSGAVAASDAYAMRAIATSAGVAEAEATAYLDRVAGELRDRELVVEAALRDQSPSDAILDEAHRTDGALVVMSTHGRSGLSRLLFGSTAQDVLRRADVPVLLIRAVESEGGE